MIKSETKDGLLTVRLVPDGARVRISLEGELDLSNAETAEASLLTALGSGEDVLVDLGKLEFIDSTGISLLVMALRMKQSGLGFLPSESAEVRRLLDLTGLDARMEFAAAEDAETGLSEPGSSDEDLPPVLPAA